MNQPSQCPTTQSGQDYAQLLWERVGAAETILRQLESSTLSAQNAISQLSQQQSSVDAHVEKAEKVLGELRTEASRLDERSRRIDENLDKAQRLDTLLELANDSITDIHNACDDARQARQQTQQVLKDETNKVEQSLSALRATSVESRRIHDDNSRLVENLRSLLTHTSESTNRLESLLGLGMQHQSAMVETLEKLTQQVSISQNMVSENHDRLDGMKTEMFKLKGELDHFANLRGEIRKLKDEAFNRMQELSEQVETADETSASLEDRITRIEQQRTQLDGMLDNTTDSMRQAGAMLESGNQNIQKLSASLDQLQTMHTEVQEMSKSVAQASRVLEKADSVRGILEQITRESEDKISGARELLGTNQALYENMVHVQQTLAHHCKEAELKAHTLSRSRVDASTILDRLNDRTREWNNRSHEVDSFIRQLVDLQKQLAEASNDTAQRQEELAALLSRQASTLEEGQNLQNRLDSILTTASISEQGIQKTLGDITRVQSDSSEGIQTLNSLIESAELAAQSIQNTMQDCHRERETLIEIINELIVHNNQNRTLVDTSSKRIKALEACLQNGRTLLEELSNHGGIAATRAKNVRMALQEKNPMSSEEDSSELDLEDRNSETPASMLRQVASGLGGLRMTKTDKEKNGS